MQQQQGKASNAVGESKQNVEVKNNTKSNNQSALMVKQWRQAAV